MFCLTWVIGVQEEEGSVVSMSLGKKKSMMNANRAHLALPMSLRVVSLSDQDLWTDS